MPSPSPGASPTAAGLGYLAGTRLVLVSVERFVFPFLPVIARGLGVSLGEAGLLLSARGVGGLTAPLTVASIGAGRSDRRLIVTALALFVTGSLLIVVPARYAIALLGFLVLGAARPAFDAASQAYLSDRTPYSRRARVLAVLELMYAGGLLVGAPLAGWLIARWDWRAPFVAGAALAVLAAVLVRPAIDPAPHTAPPRRHAVSLDREAVAFLAFAMLLLLAAEITFVVFGAWLEDVHGFSVLGLGVASIAIGGAELAGEVVTLAFADRIGKRRTVVVGCLLAAFAMIGLATSSSTFLAGFGAVALGLFAFEVAIVSAVPLASELRPAARVRFLALFAVAISSGRIVAAALGPFLYERFGVGANALVSALVFAMAAAGLLRYVSDREDDDA